MRSLFFEYPRVDIPALSDIEADVFTLQNEDMEINLPVVIADQTGIEFKLPAGLSGMFMLKVRDGKRSFSHRIALQ